MSGFNGSGVYQRPYVWINDKNNGIDITASRFDTDGNTVATALSTCICKDGQQTTTAVIPFAQGISIYSSNGIQMVGTSTGGTTIKVPTSGASLNIVLPATAGSAGNSLITDGSGNTSWSGGGGVSLLSTVNASSVASVVFSSAYITSSYNKYVVEFDSVLGSASSADLILTISTNNGSSYASTGYQYIGFYQNLANSVSTITGEYSNNTTSIPLTIGTGGIQNSSSAPSDGTLYISTPLVAQYFSCRFFVNASNLQSLYIQGKGTIGTAAAYNNIQLALSTGTLTGNFHLYGISGT